MKRRSVTSLRKKLKALKGANGQGVQTPSVGALGRDSPTSEAVAGEPDSPPSSQQPEPIPGPSSGSDENQLIRPQSSRGRNAEPFSYRERLVFQDEILKAFVRKDTFKKRTKFSVDTGKYAVRFAYSSLAAEKSHPTLMSLLGALQDCLKHVLTELRSYYQTLEVADQSDVSVHRQAFLTLHGGGLSRSLNSGNVSLMESEDILVSNILSQLTSFLQSHQELSLSSSLTFDVRVLSIKEVQEKLSGGKFSLHVPNKPNGTLPKEKLKFKACPNSRNTDIFRVPRGFPDSPNSFVDSCLLIALILAVAYMDHEENPVCTKGRKWRVVSKLHKKSNAIVNRAGKAILKDVMELQTKFGLSRTGPYTFDAVIPKAHKHFKGFQVVVFTQTSHNRINYMFPKAFDPSLRPIYLHQSCTDQDTAHVEPILQLGTYALKNGFTCPLCFETIYSRYLQHSCKAAESCKICRKIFLQPSTYVNDLLRQYYCDGKMNEGKIFCGRCKREALSTECFNHHKKYNCYKAECCSKCKKIVTKGSYPNIESALKDHKCGDQVCRFCSVRYVPSNDPNLDHMCAMKPVTLQKNWNNLSMCFFTYDTIQQENGSEVSFTVVMATFCYEKKEKGKFCLRHFLSKKTFPSYCSHSAPLDLDLDYYTEDCLKNRSRQLQHHFSRQAFGNPPRRSKADRIKTLMASDVGDSALDSFLKYALTSSFIGFSIVVPDQQGMVS